MGNSTQTLIEKYPLAMAFNHGFIFVETDKNVYYPGDTILGAIHLLINKPIVGQDGRGGVSSLDLVLKGKETFKFDCFNKKEDKSCHD